jgi:hypothetical protein
MVSWRAVFGLIAFAPRILALRATSGSPCTRACGTITNTTSEEIACLDEQYNSTKTGITFQSCISCLLQSDFQDEGSGETDVNWGLCEFLHLLAIVKPTLTIFPCIDNLRYAFTSCVYNYPEPVTNVSTPCLVSCTPLGPSLNFELTNPVGNSLTTFCGNTAFADNTVSTCEFCYSLTSQQAFLANCESRCPVPYMRSTLTQKQSWNQFDTIAIFQLLLVPPFLSVQRAYSTKQSFQKQQRHIPPRPLPQERQPFTSF